jgi:hypothetical protein
MMKGMTLYEPHASLIAVGAKVNETRWRRTEHRGEIAIHAALKDCEMAADLAAAMVAAFRSRGARLVRTFGCIVAVTELYDVLPADRFAGGHQLIEEALIPLNAEERRFGDYRLGRWVYRTRGVRRLQTPVPCRGFQCIGWTVPPNVEALVREQLIRA